jgi:hypothetical protein
MVRFALRTLLQKPPAIATLFACLASFSFLISVVLLLETRLEQAVRRAADRGPSLTVRKQNDGNPPSPSDISAVQSVTGVLRAVPSRQTPLSGLEVFVFADEEIDAVTPDILSALPWPAAVISKSAYTSASLREIASRGTLFWWVLLPATLGLLYLFFGLRLHPLNSRKDAALLKALGWTSSDIFRFFSISAGLLGAPPTLLGAVGGWVFVRLGDTAVAESILFGFQTGKAALPIDFQGVLFCIFVTVCLVFLLWMPAVLTPALHAARSDPEDLLREDGC